MKSCLNSPELFLCFFLWTSTILYTLYELFLTQTEILESYRDGLDTLIAVSPGWKFVSRLQDISDIEWNSWKYLIKTTWLYLLVSFMISEIVRKTSKSMLKLWYIVSSIIFIGLNMGFWHLMVIVIQPIIFSIILMCGAGKITIWITSIMLLQCYNSMKYLDVFWDLFDYENLHDEEIYLMLFAVPWTDLRCISFCIDYIDKKGKIKSIENNKPTYILNNIVDMFSYVLYLPVLYTGPMILYEDFEKSFKAESENLASKLKHFFWNNLLFLIYGLTLDLSLHYVYFLAMQSNIQLMRKLHLLALSGGGLWMGLEFHVKYVISYGTMGAFARLDNIDAPPTPRCIARIHIYSDLWRYFDVGLYKYLVKYIYRPIAILVSRYLHLSSLGDKLIAAFVTFVFTFMWHGHTWTIFIWATLNYLIIVLENIAKVISKSDQYKFFKQKVLKTEEMETRFVAMICAPLLILSAMSNFYLFAELETANLYFEHLFSSPLWKLLLLFVIFYSCCIVSMALENVPSRTDWRRKIVKKL